jgi:Bacterial regulatory proteins, luxR family
MAEVKLEFRALSYPSLEDLKLIRILTKQETLIYELLLKGNSRKQIADKIIKNIRTVEQHTSNIYEKLNFQPTQFPELSSRTTVINSALELSKHITSGDDLSSFLQSHQSNNYTPVVNAVAKLVLNGYSNEGILKIFGKTNNSVKHYVEDLKQIQDIDIPFPILRILTNLEFSIESLRYLMLIEQYALGKLDDKELENNYRPKLIELVNNSDTQYRQIIPSEVIANLLKSYRSYYQLYH